MTSSTSSLQGLRKGSGLRNRAESAAREREREEGVRRLRESQEEERKRKLEELKQHAQQAQKFREQQEEERRRHIDERRSNDMDRRQQVEERRRDIERSEQERREAILARNKEREERLGNQRRSSRGNIDFAFGSSAPRLIEPRVDSASGYWGSRSGAGYDKASQERDATDLRSKRPASAQGLDRSTEGDENGLTQLGTPSTAHRRRTDLVPTLTMRREDNPASGTATPRRSPGTPKPDRMKRARSVTSDAGTGIDDDNRSTTSSQSVDPARTPSRRTPSQVKAEAAARKAKASPAIQSTSRPQLSPPKSSLGAKKENGKRKGSEGGASKSPSPAVSQDHMESGVGAAGGADTSTR